MPVALLPGAVGDPLDGVEGVEGVEGAVDEGVVEDGVVEPDEDVDDGVVVEGEVVDGDIVDALDVEPVPSLDAGVVVEVVEVLVPLPEDGVAGPLEDVVLAAHPDTKRARTMG